MLSARKYIWGFVAMSQGEHRFPAIHRFYGSGADATGRSRATRVCAALSWRELVGNKAFVVPGKHL